MNKKFTNKEHLSIFIFKMVAATIISIILGLIICNVFSLSIHVFLIFSIICSSICFYFIGMGKGYYEGKQ